MVEYEAHNSIYNVLIKVGTEETCLEVFEKEWASASFGIYPYPMYKIIDIKKMIKKIEII
jgi:hypothetical protein